MCITLPLGPPSQPSPSVQVLTEHWAELPALRSRFPLAICFTDGSAQTSTLTSPFIPSSPHLCPHVCTLGLHLYSCLSIGLSVSFSRFYIHALIFDICFSLSDLLYSVYQTLGMSLSIFLHLFNSLYWNSLSFQTVVLEKTVESLLDSKEINPKGNQPWIFIGRTDAEAEAPVLWPPDVKNWLIGKDPELEKDEGRRRKEGQRMRWYKGWDDWMTSPTQWTWVWASSGRQWRTRKPGMLHAVHGVTESRTLFSNWTTTILK